MVRKMFIYIIISFTVIFNSCVFAAKLNIVTEHLNPFQIVEADSIGGLSTEIVVATLNAAGYEYSLDVHPWSVSFTRAKKENNTCIYSIARIPIRGPQFQWIGRIVSNTNSFYALKSRGIAISSINDAKKYVTAVIKDDVSHQFLLSKGFVENENLYVMSNYDGLLTLLEVSSRNIDLVIMNDGLIHRRVPKPKDVLKYSNLLEIDELNLDFHLACSLSTPKDIVNKLRHTMKELEQLGEFSKIREKWRVNIAGDR
jgi:polar amino acid transport system substrate-binding protein